MPRARQNLKLQERLDRATKVFWEKGYYDTSIQALSARAGLNRDEIYGGFGNKRKFFEMLLTRYRETYIARWFAPLEMPNATLVQVEAFFQQFLDLPVPADKLGCLMCLTSSEVSGQVRSIERIVSRFLGDLRSLIRTACVRSQERGEVPPTTDPDFVADYGVGALLGVWAMVRSPMPRSAIAHYLDGVLAFLRELQPAK
jgi:TetR/AcrR family transcriptional regulator, transcriptional repressor for nem operon